jgi:3-hydroxyethyl bacteriochlorophyllide a dehydrogenase
VLGLKPGDRVFSRNCKSPKGWKGTWWGGHTGYHVAHYQSVIKLPDGVSTQEASFLLLAQVGFNGAIRPRVIPGDAAVVIGDGLVGQYAAQVLKYRGAYVIMTGLMQDRLKLASLYSADEVINAGKRDIRQYIKEKYPEGVSLVVETASKLDLIRTAIDLIKRNGQVVLNGYYPQGENLINYHWLRDKETTIYCPNSRTRERLELTLDLIEQGYMQVKGLITHEFDITKAPDAYTNLLDNSAHFLGMVFNWKRGSGLKS